MAELDLMASTEARWKGSAPLPWWWGVMWMDVPLKFTGMPGVGKTAIMEGVAASSLRYPEDERGVHLWMSAGNKMMPTDLIGAPVVMYDELWPGEDPEDPHAMRGLVRFKPLIEVLTLRDEARKGGAIFCVDEFTTIEPSMQAALLTIIQDHRFGEVKIAGRLAVVAIENPPEIAVGGYTLAPPTNNRFMHIPWDVKDYQSFADGIKTRWGMRSITGRQFDAKLLPPVWHQHPALPLWDGLLSEFIKARPAAEFVFDANQAINTTPRTWDYAMRAMCVVEPQYRLRALEGLVGPGPGKEFLTFVERQDLPSPEAIVQDPTILDNLKSADKAIAIMESVALHIEGLGRRPTDDEWRNAWRAMVWVKEKIGLDAVLISLNPLARVTLNLYPDLPNEIPLEHIYPALKQAGMV